MQNALASWLPFVLMLGMFYLIIFIPEKRRKKKYGEMINSLKVNDEIMTKGGIMGKVVTLKDDYIVLESGPDRARLKFTKNSISTVVSSKESVETDK